MNFFSKILKLIKNGVQIKTNHRNTVGLLVWIVCYFISYGGNNMELPLLNRTLSGW